VLFIQACCDNQRPVCVVFALLSKKDEKSYSKLFSILVENDAFEPGVSPLRVMTDYELGLMNAVGKALPWAEV